jgi:L-ascorbate metabolism protein UlaG (beta-lactamase superfamily)
MKKARSVTLGSALAVCAVVALATCASPPRMPALDGAVIEIRRSDDALHEGDAGYAEQLQLYWFGSACHLIQLGGVSVLMDPFVTNDFKFFGLASDPKRVSATLGRIPTPNAVLINHSHHDHLLDAYAAMSLPQWTKRNVPLYGGLSALHLLAGFEEGKINPRWHAVEQGHRIKVAGTKPGYSAEVIPYRSAHGPHLKCGFTFANGLVPEPRTTPPRNLADFQAGEVFNYLIKLRGPGGSSFNVFCLGAPFHIDELSGGLPPEGTRIDVAIILAPVAENVRGYPQEHLARLRPRNLVFSHFNTFLKEDPDEQLAFGPVDFVRMPEFSRDVQGTFVRNAAGYKEFGKLYIPAITTIDTKGFARNVIRIR